MNLSSFPEYKLLAHCYSCPQVYLGSRHVLDMICLFSKRGPNNGPCQVLGVCYFQAFNSSLTFHRRHMFPWTTRGKKSLCGSSFPFPGMSYQNPLRMFTFTKSTRTEHVYTSWYADSPSVTSESQSYIYLSHVKGLPLGPFSFPFSPDRPARWPNTL